LRAAARGSAAGCRHFRDAVLALSACKLRVGIAVGGSAADPRRCRLACHRLDLALTFAAEPIERLSRHLHRFQSAEGRAKSGLLLRAPPRYHPALAPPLAMRVAATR